MIQIVYSTEQWIVPRIVIGILIVLGLILIISTAVKNVKAGKPIITFGKFFVENPDFKKLFGSVILFVAYIYLLEVIGFTVTSIIFVFLFNVLYAGVSKKSMITSVIIAIVAPLFISILFGVVFGITLPKGICTLYLTNIAGGITIY